MTETRKKALWGARMGWLMLALVFLAFVWGMNRRARLEATGVNVIRMLFVPSVEQGTLVERGDELARFIRRDSGLILRSEVPTSYAAVIQALGSGPSCRWFAHWRVLPSWWYATPRGNRLDWLTWPEEAWPCRVRCIPN